MKVKSKIFKGIEYIQVVELPQEQQEILTKTLNKSFIIKILINGKVVRDCIQFKDYLTWYENIFKLQGVAEEQKEKPQAILVKEIDLVKKIT